MTDEHSAPEKFHCPHCGEETPVSEPDSPTLCPKCNKEFVAARLETMPSPGAPRDLGEMPELAPGVEVGGYRLEKEVGRGGMGIVFEAVQKSLGRKVAVKVLPRKLVGDPEFVARFEREGLALAQLNHPNIVQVIDKGISGEICFLVMEFVEGVSLRRVIEGGELTTTQALAIVPQICAALEYAHGKGVVHRDIKPENIMMDTDGSIKITDFGLARLVHGESAEAIGRLTRTNVMMGTPDYMAPEQREKAKEVDHRADIYSLGVIFYEMLTGELPLGRFPPPSRKVEVDVKLDEVVFKALEKEPELRYQRASHMHRDVTEVRDGSTPVAVIADNAGGRDRSEGSAGHVHFGAAGVHIRDGEEEVHVGRDGIHIRDGKEEVRVGRDGVYTRKDGKEVRVGSAEGVNVKSNFTTCGHATASLVFGILALLGFSCAMISPLLAVILGFVARNKIRDAKGKLSGDGMALFGIAAGFGMLLLDAFGVVTGGLGMLSVFPLLDAARSSDNPEGMSTFISGLVGGSIVVNGIHLFGRIVVLAAAIYVSVAYSRNPGEQSPESRGRISGLALVAFLLALLPLIVLFLLILGLASAALMKPTLHASRGRGGDGVIIDTGPGGLKVRRSLAFPGLTGRVRPGVRSVILGAGKMSMDRSIVAALRPVSIRADLTPGEQILVARTIFKEVSMDSQQVGALTTLIGNARFSRECSAFISDNIGELSFDSSHQKIFALLAARKFPPKPPSSGRAVETVTSPSPTPDPGENGEGAKR